MAKDKIRVNVTRAEAADRLVQLADQVRTGTVSLGATPVTVPENVELECEAKSDKVEMEIKWR